MIGATRLGAEEVSTESGQAKGFFHQINSVDNDQSTRAKPTVNDHASVLVARAVANVPDGLGRDGM